MAVGVPFMPVVTIVGDEEHMMIGSVQLPVGARI